MLRAASGAVNSALGAEMKERAESPLHSNRLTGIETPDEWLEAE
jgi:hypothetical protein